ncbi:hypothetical protein [Kineosporia sp. R_H_3]|uniref:hypothetical protein n=1 Tax=Kineosporia sp. R_H_3 TaxID=1961848 RepID=UPI000B4ADFF3|nr:hypothetical protein [Kineosporia sp. R_H_3]
MQGRRAGLPDLGSAQGWAGRILVDRDGMEIGICRTIFTDDDTGLPEWATADVRGRPVLVPLVDAVESGPRVRVVVRGVDVAGAPQAQDDRHVSVEEEERLYRHYGIAYSRAGSGSGLPVGPAEAQRARHLAATREARRRRTLVLALEAAVVLAAVVGAVVVRRHGAAAGAGRARHP